MKYNTFVNRQISIKTKSGTLTVETGTPVMVCTKGNGLILQVEGKSININRRQKDTVLEAVTPMSLLDTKVSQKPITAIEAVLLGLDTRQITSLVYEQVVVAGKNDLSEMTLPVFDATSNISINTKLAAYSEMDDEEEGEEGKDKGDEEEADEVKSEAVKFSMDAMPLVFIESHLTKLYVSHDKNFVAIHNMSESTQALLLKILKTADQTVYVREGKVVIRNSDWVEADLSSTLMTLLVQEGTKDEEPPQNAKEPEDSEDASKKDKEDALKKEACAKRKKEGKGNIANLGKHAAKKKDEEDKDDDEDKDDK